MELIISSRRLRGREVFFCHACGCILLLRRHRHLRRRRHHRHHHHHLHLHSHDHHLHLRHRCSVSQVHPFCFSCLHQIPSSTFLDNTH